MESDRSGHDTRAHRGTAASPRVAVIGAGAGGLSIARHLKEAGVDVVVYELGSYVGGLWVLDNDNGLSAAYESLHINSEPKVTHYRDFPFPEGTPLFPTHTQMRAYFEAFVEHFDLRQHIRFNTRVVRVEAGAGAADRRWVLTIEDEGGRSQEEFTDVVVASGHQGRPAHPPLAEEFTGTYLHSHDYRNPAPFEGQRVLVVGIGNSGLDVAADVCVVAESTAISVRSPVLIMPRMICGLPTSRVLAKLRRLPWPLQRLGQIAVSRVAHGRMEEWGMTTPKTRTHPASNPTFMAHVSYDRIAVRPAIEKVSGDEVVFSDGSMERYDTVIAATGYEIDLPFLAAGLDPTSGRRLLTYKRVLHPRRPGLYFVGFFNVSGGSNVRMMDTQSELVTAFISGKVDPPDQSTMLADIDRDQRALQRRYPHAPRYGLELDPKDYPRDVAAALAGNHSSVPRS